MEIHVVLDNGEPVPGTFLTGTVYLHLTSYLPRPGPSVASHLLDDDDDAELSYQEQLERERLRLMESSASFSAFCERSELLDALQLQIVGKCLPDSGRIPADVLRGFQPNAADANSFVLYSSPAVTLDSFDHPQAFDVLHQPYTYAFSALLPPSLPPSYRGSSHKIGTAAVPPHERWPSAAVRG